MFVKLLLFTVLECLEGRYHNDWIYTGAGSTLVVVNPYKQCLHLYGDDIISQYNRHDASHHNTVRTISIFNYLQAHAVWQQTLCMCVWGGSVRRGSM